MIKARPPELGLIEMTDGTIAAVLVLRTQRFAVRWLAEADAHDYWRDGHGLWGIEVDGAEVGTCGLVPDGDALGLVAAGEKRFAALPAMFLPGAAITIRRPASVETLTLREFVEPRAALLFGERLRDFEEHEVHSDTRIVGNRTLGRRIAGLAWEDD